MRLRTKNVRLSAWHAGRTQLARRATGVLTTFGVLALCVAAAATPAPTAYRIEVSMNGDAATAVSGQSGRCGKNCYLVAPGSVFTVDAKPKPGFIARFSGACQGRCQFTPQSNGVVHGFVFPFKAIGVILDSDDSIDDRIFFSGFEL